MDFGFKIKIRVDDRGVLLLPDFDFEDKRKQRANK